MSVMQCKTCGDYVDTDMEEFNFDDMICERCEDGLPGTSREDTEDV